MKKYIASILVAAGLWFVMFSPWTAPFLNFWMSMGISAGVLLLLSFFLGTDWKNQFRINFRSILLGLFSAGILWEIFYLGNSVSKYLFDFAPGQIQSIYGLRDGTPHSVIAILLLFWIGPAEVIFWQGFIQRHWMKASGDFKGFLYTTLIYAFVHIWSFNFMLLMAALVCGVYWGLMYMYFKPRNLVSLVISHAVWDAAVFIVFPI